MKQLEIVYLLISFAQVESFAKPSEEATKAVTDWLSSNGIDATVATPAGDWLAFSVPVSKANALLNANYTLFRDLASGSDSVRTLAYSVPSELVEYIRAIHLTTS